MPIINPFSSRNNNQATFDKIVEANLLPFAEDVARAQGKVLQAQAKAEEIAAALQLEALNSTRANKPVNEINRLKDAASNISDDDRRERALKQIDDKYVEYLSSKGIKF